MLPVGRRHARTGQHRRECVPKDLRSHSGRGAEVAQAHSLLQQLGVGAWKGW